MYRIFKRQHRNKFFCDVGVGNYLLNRAQKFYLLSESLMKRYCIKIMIFLMSKGNVKECKHRSQTRTSYFITCNNYQISSLQINLKVAKSTIVN